MRWLLSVCVGWALTSAVWAQDDKKPAAKEDDKKPAAAAKEGDSKVMDIVKRADVETKKVKRAKYDVAFFGPDAKEPLATGTVVLGEGVGENIGKFLMDLKIKGGADKEPQRVVIGSDGDMTFVIDFAKKKVFADIDPSVLGRRMSQLVGGCAMREYIHPKPFDDEINATKQELRGTKKVGDEECNEVLIEYKQAPQKAVWFFSTKDGLPRRVDRFNPSGREADAKGTWTQLHVTKLEPGGKIDAEVFKLKVPEGFEKTDDPAP